MFYLFKNIKMVMNFPAIVKTTDVLSPEDLVNEIKNGNLVEAQLPNGVLKLSQEWNFLVFDGLTTTGEHDKRALMIHSKTDDELAKWINNLIPVESEEDRIDRLRWEQENELRAASIDEDNAWDVAEGIEEVLDNIPDCEYYDEDAAFNQFYFG